MRLPNTLLLLAILVAGLQSKAPAQVADILWNSSFFGDNRDSTDASLDASFTFYLGVFNPPVPESIGDPWEPEAANTGEWAEHWITADVITYNTGNSNFSSAYEAEPLVDGISLTGKQGYIWGVNREGPNGEWILITNPAWSWPAPGTGGLGFPKTWTASQGSAIVGQLNQAGIDPNTELTINAEVSSDLVNWFDDPGHVVLEDQSGTEFVFRDLTPVSPDQPIRLIRLRAELP
jgi:hypothetical protein